MIAAKYGILTLIRLNPSVKSNLCANGQRNCTVVTHKNGGTHNKVLSKLSKEF